MTSLPRLLALADRLQERQKCGNAEGRGNDGKRTGRGVTHVLVHVVDIWTHGRDHCGQPRRLQRHNDITRMLLIQVGKMSTGDDYGHRQGRNGEFCVTVGPVTRTAGILTQSVIWRSWAVC